MMLPDDVLADVLSRLPPRGLAASRSVCAAWRDVIDARGLLRADLLPLTLPGLFVNYVAPLYNFAELFSRRPRSSSASANNNKPPITYPRLMQIYDHCNGLLLYYDGVLNPATGAFAAVPDCPPPPPQSGGSVPLPEDFRQDKYLVFDPTVSPHYEVFAIPRVPYRQNPDDDADGCRIVYILRHVNVIDGALLESAWPLSPCTLNVFSSVTGRWETRSFDRDGDEIAGSVADVQLDERFWMRRRNAVYWRGKLYVHCENDFIMRISFTTNKYRMIKPPRVECEYLEFHLGKSEKGVYYALVDGDNRLRVWILAESSYGQIEWTLTHDSGCNLFLPSLKCIPKDHGPWILHEMNREFKGDENASAIITTEHEYDEWNSDDDTILQHEDGGISDSGYLDMLAFHPYKEIIFLHRSLERGLAYHLNSSRLEDLGNLRPKKMDIDDIGTCFPYTPCRIGELSKGFKSE